MRQSGIAALLVLVGCSAQSPNEERLFGSRWAASKSGCDTNYLAFKDDLIALYKDGRSRPLFEIIDNRSTPDAPTGVFLRLKAHPDYVSGASGVNARPITEDVFELGLDVREDYMLAGAVRLDGVTRAINKGEDLDDLFRVWRCPDPT